MAYQKTKEGTTRTKKNPGYKVVPGVKKAAKKIRRSEDTKEEHSPYYDPSGPDGGFGLDGMGD